MSAARRKGWCPGTLRPMAAGDGLVVRLRLTSGILAVGTACSLADLAERHGNGCLDLTSLANLQMRGIGERTLPALQEALRGLRLVDADAASEAVRNVIASPLAGLHDGLDTRPLVAALEGRLAGTRALHELPPKVLFLVDDGSAPSLAGITADVRFDWCPEAEVFAIGLGGTRADAVAAGTCVAQELVDCAETIARGVIAGFARAPEVRRMRALVAVLGADAVLQLCDRARDSGAAKPKPEPVLLSDGTRHTDPGSPLRFVRDDDALTLTAPYGRLDAGMLHVAAELAATGLGELRMTPWRSLLLPGVDAARLRDRAKQVGWIIEHADPRRVVAACVGAPDCGRATTPTRADADALADLAVALGRGRTALHVSGCAKGCAHAGPAPVVLVGREGRYDLVRDGRAGDPPVRRDLDLAAARDAIAMLLLR